MDCDLSGALVSAGTAYRMDGRNFQVAVLALMTLYAGGVLGVFLHVVQLLMGDNAGGGDRLADVVGERHATVAAMNFPGAAVPSGQEILVAAFGFGKAACDPPDFCLRFLVCERRCGATAQQKYTGDECD
jgi:hypothetical protein